MRITEEAVKALELVPVPLLDYEIDGDKAPKLENIKYTTNSLRKLSYVGYYITGMGGLPEIIPHATQMEASINEWPNVSHVERVLAFKKSLAGTALSTANQVLARLRAALDNNDNNQEGDTATFHDFVVAYCQATGHTEDKQNQREGIRHMKKHVAIPTHRWWTIQTDKNDLIEYLQAR
jgi:hypothetical protein